MRSILKEHIHLDGLDAVQLQRLLTISTQLSSTLELDKLLQLVMDVATELTDTQAASILLVEPHSGQLHFAASMGSQVPLETAVPLDHSLAGWVVRNGRPLVIDDVQSDDRFYNAIDRNWKFTTRSMVALPLITNQKVIGALEVLNKENNAAYSKRDVAVLEALAAQSAVAIANARLFAQSDLLAEIMHELKTPLMSIMAASDLLEHPELPGEKRQGLVSTIRKESTRLSKMTQDFLVFARLEADQIRLERKPVDITTIVNEAIALTQPQATLRNIQIVAKISADLPVLLADHDRLKQVLLNLISNAVKYNVDNGRITINISAKDQEIQMTVADTGQGISSNDMLHLFEPFFRVAGSERISEGSGLGLTITHKLVAQHNGRITVESSPGKGTAFTVSLPTEPIS